MLRKGQTSSAGFTSRPPRLRVLLATFRSALPSLSECVLALTSAALLVIAFPNLELWPLSWVALVPLVVSITRNPRPSRAFFMGLLFGAVFFYASCYWLTYSMINFGGIPAPIAYAMLVPGAIIMGLFPALFAVILALVARRFGSVALVSAPFMWVGTEWARLQCTGQLWNAVGYSQAFQPWLIQASHWGGVYLVSFIVVAANSALVLLTLRTKRKVFAAAVLISVSVLIIGTSYVTRPQAESFTDANTAIGVVAIQPNVPMELEKPLDQMRTLTDEHFTTSEAALRTLPTNIPRLIIWPESPMNFSYGTDVQLRERLSLFARSHNTSVIFNSQEPAPNEGLYNSALLVNEQGGLVAQYDKIRLLPFGEYDPLPRWFPGAGLITAIVGDFTPGTNYRQMEIGRVRAGVFICIESAYPNIARRYAHDGSNLLINISNDGYLGPTAVMRQHLANAVFRAVENSRPLLRVTNTGITAAITSRGEIRDATRSFERDVRIWKVSEANSTQTFYTKHGDVFAIACAVITLLLFVASLSRKSVNKA